MTSTHTEAPAKTGAEAEAVRAHQRCIRSYLADKVWPHLPVKPATACGAAGGSAETPHGSGSGSTHTDRTNDGSYRLAELKQSIAGARVSVIETQLVRRRMKDYQRHYFSVGATSSSGGGSSGAGTRLVEERVKRILRIRQSIVALGKACTAAFSTSSASAASAAAAPPRPPLPASAAAVVRSLSASQDVRSPAGLIGALCELLERERECCWLTVACVPTQAQWRRLRRAVRSDLERSSSSNGGNHNNGDGGGGAARDTRSAAASAKSETDANAAADTYMRALWDMLANTQRIQDPCGTAAPATTAAAKHRGERGGGGGGDDGAVTDVDGAEGSRGAAVHLVSDSSGDEGGPGADVQSAGVDAAIDVDECENEEEEDELRRLHTETQQQQQEDLAALERRRREKAAQAQPPLLRVPLFLSLADYGADLPAAVDDYTRERKARGPNGNGGGGASSSLLPSGDDAEAEERRRNFLASFTIPASSIRLPPPTRTPANTNQQQRRQRGEGGGDGRGWGGGPSDGFGASGSNNGGGGGGMGSEEYGAGAAAASRAQSRHSGVDTTSFIAYMTAALRDRWPTLEEEEEKATGARVTRNEGGADGGTDPQIQKKANVAKEEAEKQQQDDDDEKNERVEEILDKVRFLFTIEMIALVLSFRLYFYAYATQDGVSIVSSSSAAAAATTIATATAAGMAPPPSSFSSPSPTTATAAGYAATIDSAFVVESDESCREVLYFYNDTRGGTATATNDDTTTTNTSTGSSKSVAASSASVAAVGRPRYITFMVLNVCGLRETSYCLSYFIGRCVLQMRDGSALPLLRLLASADTGNNDGSASAGPVPSPFTGDANSRRAATDSVESTFRLSSGRGASLLLGPNVRLWQYLLDYVVSVAEGTAGSGGGDDITTATSSASGDARRVERQQQQQVVLSGVEREALVRAIRRSWRRCKTSQLTLLPPAAAGQGTERSGITSSTDPTGSNLPNGAAAASVGEGEAVVLLEGDEAASAVSGLGGVRVVWSELLPALLQ